MFTGLGGSSLGSLDNKILSPVQDITELKALDTTSATNYPDKSIIVVEDHGIYRLDRESSDVEVIDTVIQPTTGVGRWLKIANSTADHNLLSGLQGGISNERYHLTLAQLNKLNALEIFFNYINVTADTITLTDVLADVYNNKHVVLTPATPENEPSIDVDEIFSKNVQFLLTNAGTKNLLFTDFIGNYTLFSASYDGTSAGVDYISILSGQTVLIKVDNANGIIFISDGSRNLDTETIVPSKFASKVLNVELTSVTNISGTYNSATSKLIGTSNGLLSIDGVSTSGGKFVLLTGQTDKVQNGIYFVNIAGSGATPFEMTRYYRWNSSGYVKQNTLCVATLGDNNKDKYFRYTNSDVYVNGTTLQDWVLSINPLNTTTVGNLVNNANNHTTPIDGDYIGIFDSVASILKKLSWANLKVTLKAYFDTLYNLYIHPNHSGDVVSSGDGNTTIQTNVVSNSKLAQIGQGIFKGRKTAGTGNVEDLTVPDVKELLSLVDLDNYKIIKSLSDFPTPVGGVITLVANTIYRINGFVNIGTNKFQIVGDNRFIGGSAFLDGIISTISGQSVFNSTNCNLSFSNLTLSSTGATSSLFNCTDAGTKSFILIDCVALNSVSLGTITGFDNALFNTLDIKNNSNGFLVNNCTHLFCIACNFEENNAGTYFSVQSGVFETLIFRNTVFHVDSPNTGLNINAAGITVSSNGSVNGCVFFGSGTKTIGFTATNSDFVVRSNIGLDDFKARASMTMTGNSTQTSNVPGSTWTKIVGTTSLNNAVRFDMPTTNRLRYIGKETIKVKVNMACATYYTSGSSRIAEIGVYKNSLLENGSQNGMTIYSADEPCATNAIITLNQNDYIEGWFQKFGGAPTDDYVFSYLNIQVTEE